MTTRHHHHRSGSGQLGPIFRADSGSDQLQSYMEKRQLFLRSYQFSRKQSLGERIKQSFIRFKRILRVRIRSVRRIRKVVWSGLRFALHNKRRRLAKIMNYYYYYYYNNNNNGSSKNMKMKSYSCYEQLFYKSPSPSSCFVW